jgi:hypothetical protein
MTLATAAAVAIASKVSLVVPSNDSNNIPNQTESAISHLFSLKRECILFFQAVTNLLLEEVVQARCATVCEEEATSKDVEIVENVEMVNNTAFENEEEELIMAFNILICLRVRMNSLCEVNYPVCRGREKLHCIINVFIKEKKE